MKKHLFIHVGHYKTGTTALQDFFVRNVTYLKIHGFEYPSVLLEYNKHSLLAFAMLREGGVEKLMHGYNNPVSSGEFWRELADHVRGSAFPNTLVSTEELIRIGELDDASDRLSMVAGLLKEIDVKIIIYLRNPQSHLASWHNQLIKMGIPVSDLATAVCRGEIESIHTDFAKAVRPWVRCFGADNVILRDYDKARIGHTGIIQDFLGIIGVPFSDDLDIAESDPNPRLDDRASELVRLIQNAGIPPLMIKALVGRFAEYLAAQDIPSDRHPTSFQEVRNTIGASLESLKIHPNSNLDIEAFRARLPRLEAPDADHWQLTAGFLLNEILLLRRQMNTSIAALENRIRILETQKDGAPATPAVLK